MPDPEPAHADPEADDETPGSLPEPDSGSLAPEQAEVTGEAGGSGPSFFEPLATASREARRLEVHDGDATEPSRTWVDEDQLGGEPAEAMVVVLRTRGCRWALGGGCTFCGYVNDSFIRKIDGSELVEQFETALDDYEGQRILKVYTSGSFFDPYEVEEPAQAAILERVPDPVEHVVVEAQAVDVTEDRLADAGPALHDDAHLEIGVGLESADEDVARYSVNKEFYLDDYREAAEVAGRHGASLKAYTMVKPPFLTEREALEDCVATARDAGPHSSTVSFNPTNVQKDTLVDDLYRRREYRPPWLWTVVEVLKRASRVTDAHLKSDPVAAGQRRGAHNCGGCDDAVADAIQAFNDTQDPSLLEGLDCDCKETWRDVLELERFWQGAFRDPREDLF